MPPDDNFVLTRGSWLKLCSHMTQLSVEVDWSTLSCVWHASTWKLTKVCNTRSMAAIKQQKVGHCSRGLRTTSIITGSSLEASAGVTYLLPCNCGHAPLVANFGRNWVKFGSHFFSHWHTINTQLTCSSVLPWTRKLSLTEDTPHHSTACHAKLPSRRRYKY